MDSSNKPTSGSVPAGHQTPLQLDRLIGKYVALRDRKRELEAKHKEQLTPFNQIMAEIEAKLLDHMQSSGINSIATSAGTAYQSTTPRATIKDRTAFRQWVVETGSFDIVDWKASPTGVFNFIQDHEGMVPPGINASTYTAVRFRRPGEEE